MVPQSTISNNEKNIIKKATKNYKNEQAMKREDIDNNNIILASTTVGATVLSIADATNFSYSSITGGFVSNAAVARTYTFGTTGGTATNAPNLSITSGVSIPTFTTGSWFKTLNFTGSSSTIYGSTGQTAPINTTINLKNLTLGSGIYTNVTANITATGSISGNSKSIAAMGIAHTGTTTITSALTVVGTTVLGLGTPTLALSGVDLTTGTFSSSGTNTRAISFGSNFIVVVLFFISNVVLIIKIRVQHEVQHLNSSFTFDCI